MRTKRLAHEVPDGALFYAPDLLDGERRMTFYVRDFDVSEAIQSRYVGVRRLGLMQFRIDGSKRVNLRVPADVSSGLLARMLPVVELRRAPNAEKAPPTP